MTRAVVAGSKVGQRDAFVPGCSGKVSYDRRSKAVQAARSAAVHVGRPLYPYRCGACRGYHLSSSRIRWTADPRT